MIRGAHGNENGRKTLESEKSWRNSEIMKVIQVKEDITGTGRDKNVEEQKDQKRWKRRRENIVKGRIWRGWIGKPRKIK